MIPKSVTNEELQTALAPLYDLLGVDGARMYSPPGLHITANAITFTAVPERVPPVRVEGLRHPQGEDDAAELSFSIEVRVA